MAQAKLDVPEKSGGGIKEKDKDSEEKEGMYLFYTNMNHCVIIPIIQETIFRDTLCNDILCSFK